MLTSQISPKKPLVSTPMLSTTWLRVPLPMSSSWSAHGGRYPLPSLQVGLRLGLGLYARLWLHGRMAYIPMAMDQLRPNLGASGHACSLHEGCMKGCMPRGQWPRLLLCGDKGVYPLALLVSSAVLTCQRHGAA